MQQQTSFIAKFFTQLIDLVSSGWGIAILILSTLFQTLFNIEGFQVSLIALGILVLADFLTGCIASYKEFEGPKGWSFFESKKFRETISKTATYFLFIAMGWVLYRLFFNAPIKIPFSTKGVNIIQIFFGICIAIESWSILENMKRLGFDLIGRVVKTFKAIWSTINTVKNG